MLALKEMKNDERFNINYDKLFKNCDCIDWIKDYTLEEVEIRKIFCKYTKDHICSIDKTIEYGYLSGSFSCKEAYREECIKENVSYRTPDIYDSVISSIKKDGYDIKKSAIVIDEYGLLYDGKHRASVICSLFGGDKRIMVVQLRYNHSHPRWLLLSCRYKIIETFRYTFRDKNKKYLPDICLRYI